MKHKRKQAQDAYQWRVFDPDSRKYLSVRPTGNHRDTAWTWHQDYETASRFSEAQATQIATSIIVIFGRQSWLCVELKIENKGILFAERRQLPEARADLGAAWNQGCLPDDEIRVLVRTDGIEDPVIVAYHADGGWWGDDGVAMPLDVRVLGWMHLEAAASVLDGAPF